MRLERRIEMTWRRTAIGGAICLLHAAGVLAQPGGTSVTLANGGGQPVGIATLFPEGARGVRIVLEIKGLPPASTLYIFINTRGAIHRRSSPLVPCPYQKP
jgi:hypothetical protein